MEATSPSDSSQPARTTPPRGIRGSFRAKLFAVTATVIVILSAAFIIFFLSNQHTILHEKLATEGQLLTRLLAHNVRPGLFAGNRDQLADLAAGVLTVPDVVEVTIADRDGRPVAHLTRSSKSGAVPRSRLAMEFSEPVFALQGKGSESDLYFSPAEQPEQTGQLLGTVRIVMDEEKIHAHVRRLTVTATFAALAFLALGTGLVYLVIRGITRPLTHLAEGVKAIESGEKDVSIPVESEDEIGSLTASFNTMTDTLRQRSEERDEAERQLRDLNARLEEKVSARTIQLEEANRELESFSYSAAHDLRAPLLRLNGLCKALKEDCGERLDEETRGYFRRIATVGKQMERVISAMSTLFNIQRREMTRREIDLSAVVRATVATLREADPLRDVMVAVEPAMAVCGDTELLFTAMENLVGNAWKFTSRTAEARIEFGRVEREGETVYFLRDNGAGFDMAYADKLFKPFERLHSHGEFPGTGVGLAIVHRIIERHGGRIWLESTPGAGTTCYFTLPS
ncbi:ATP-binding protein [Geobacter sp.]|uniref:sensor histidine kinase n=1 Tax=Geobacter sp. TaxID=46610 RepID=UPI0027BA9B21|nr:ATP-binding protein [Geobacter sp.]